MRALIESIQDSIAHCLIENGNHLTLHVSVLPEGSKEGDIVSVVVKKNEEGSKRQQELIAGFHN